MAFREEIKPQDPRTLKSKEVIRIPLEELVSIVESYLRVKTGNSNVMVLNDGLRITTGDQGKLTGVNVEWENQYK